MPAATISNSSNSPFIKSLACSNRTTRDRALDSLRTYLKRPTPFSEIELLKLWKGLYFCIWMSDKPLNQQRLARDLASLVDVLKVQENVLAWFKAFWTTIAREWGGIDALRMDKFLYLARCYVNKGFEYVRGSGKDAWGDGEIWQKYEEILDEVPLNIANGKIPNGIRFHVIDIYVDELDKVDVDRNAALETILRPLRRLGTKTHTKAIRERVAGALDDERLKDWENAGVEDDEASNENEPEAVEGDDEEFGGFDD